MYTLTEYLHAIDGRLRIKVPEVKGSPGSAQAIREQLHARYGIDKVYANPTTGNVLIQYHPDQINQAEIIRILKDELGYFKPAAADSRPHEPSGGWAGMVARAVVESALQSVVMALI